MACLSNPVDGEDAEYNRWYHAQHMLDVLSIDVVPAAQRFEYVTSSGGPDPHKRYLAIYEIEANSPDEAIGAKARLGPQVKCVALRLWIQTYCSGTSAR
jgi:hypothetical protein